MHSCCVLCSGTSKAPVVILHSLETKKAAMIICTAAMVTNLNITWIGVSWSGHAKLCVDVDLTSEYQHISLAFFFPDIVAQLT